ncbi:MAG: hypothetical protein WAT41_02385 [Flavobacteriales bacterium]
MRRIIFTLLLIILFLQLGFGQKSEAGILTSQLNDSINHFKELLSKSTSPHFENFKLGQFYYFKATKIPYSQLQIQHGNLTGKYYHNCLDSALLFLNKSIQQNERHPPSYYYRALVRINNAKEEKLIDKLALKDYSTAIKLDPDNSFYYLERADYCLELKPKSAITDYSKAIKLSPTDCRGYLGRAITRERFKTKMSKESEALIENDFQKALELKCDSSEVLLSRGIRRLYETKNYNGAILDMSFVINHPQQYEWTITQALYERGCAYYYTNRLDLSCQDFKKFKELGGGGWVWIIKESCGIDFDTWNKK